MTRPPALEQAFDRALRGLRSARCALVDVQRQMSMEQQRVSAAEAWRAQRLHQALTARLTGVGKEVRALRAESARIRREVVRW